jgi:hypothetical protein
MKVCYTQNDIAEMERDTNGNIIMPEVVEAYIEKPAEGKLVHLVLPSPEGPLSTLDPFVPLIPVL